VKKSIERSERPENTNEFSILTPTLPDATGLKRSLSIASRSRLPFDSTVASPYVPGVSTNKSKAPLFESSLQELEKIISTLEKGDQPLEEQLKAFERGVTLSRECLKQLDEVEKKVQILVQDGSGGLSAQDFSK
jgi:exodeoxyribonuclease VII small subunit